MDIVERLRGRFKVTPGGGGSWTFTSSDREDAAAEIERLRAERDRLRYYLQIMIDWNLAPPDSDPEKLRIALTQARAALAALAEREEKP